MDIDPGRRYSIGEVSELLELPAHILRQWEERFPQLSPKRDRANRRYYQQRDIDIARRIKQLMWHEKMTTEGARVRLAQELRGIGRPKTRQDLVDLVDRIENRLRDAIDALDRAAAGTGDEDTGPEPGEENHDPPDRQDAPPPIRFDKE